MRCFITKAAKTMGFLRHLLSSSEQRWFETHAQFKHLLHMLMTKITRLRECRCSYFELFVQRREIELIENFTSLYTAYSRSIKRLRIQLFHTKSEWFHVSTQAKTMGSVFPDGRMGGSCFRYLSKFKLVKKNCIFSCQVLNPFPPNFFGINYTLSAPCTDWFSCGRPLTN